VWCAARVLHGSQEIALADAHPATEDIGPVAGDSIFAQFACPNGVNATFSSRGANRETAEPYGMELIGTKGAVRILADVMPKVYVLISGAWMAQGKTIDWRPLDKDPTLGLPASENTAARANQRVVDDWLAAIEEGRDPICSGYAGMKALEMAMAVFAAGLARQRVDFPLKSRRHPLRPPGP
jgi:hypothetical protein